MIRKPAVAGQFYPKDPSRLRSDISGYIKASAIDASPQSVSAIVAPHAGYPFSGATAGYGYARVMGECIQRVILLGCSHHYRFDGASIVTSGLFETPLGPFPIDSKFAGALAKSTGNYRSETHLPEHSLEVQLPFVAVAMGPVPIVPVLFGSVFTDWHRRFADTLADMAAPGDLVIVSTDLSHFLDEAGANHRDRISLDMLLTQNVDDLLAGAADGRCSMCGVTAVAVGMRYSLQREARRWSLLDYRTSAQASGNTDRVVGYGSVSMECAP